MSEFAAAGTYTYVVTEAEGGIGGVTYDGTEHVVTFEVEDDLEDSLVLAEGTEQLVTVDIENTYEADSRDVSVKKIWNDADDADTIRPDTIQAQLFADGDAYGKPVALSEANGWSYTWTGLEATRNGKAIAYTVDEVSVPNGYTKTISGDATTGFVITNTHKPDKPHRMPKTGDEFDRTMMQVLGLAGATLAGIGAVLVVRGYLRRKEDEI